MVAALLRRYGDFDLAEDCTQDALLAAVRVWLSSGIPQRPGAWLTTAARRRALDRLRRRQGLQAKLAQSPPAVVEGGDDRLRLMFTCCHPALSREAQLALTLRTVAGFTTRQIASAFLISEATVAQRIVRAKRQIVDAGIPYRMPAPADLDRRLDEVLAVLYLMFNEGYLSSSWEVPHDRDLAEDAAWLAELAVRVLPRQAEAMGLLALFQLQLARVRGRFSDTGTLIRLAEQDRSLWDAAAITSAVELLDRAAHLRQPGPYQLQAAIAACHAEAPSWEATDWPLILRLYDRLLDLQPSPVIRLNRAVALWLVAGAVAALAEVERLAAGLGQYHLLHSTRGELQRELGLEAEAQASFQRALDLTLNPAERSHLRARMASA